MRMPDMRDDDGFALAAVITAMALITVIAIAGFAVAREASNSSLRNSREERAYQAASTGLDRALATFSDTDGNWPKESTINGSDSYRVDKIIYSSGDRDYELVSLGRSGETTEIVRVRFVYMDLWDMNISGGDNSNMGSGAGFNGNGTIIGKVYCNGDFDWTGSAELLGGPIFVKNGVFERQSSGNQIGTTGDPVEMYLDQDPLGVTFDSLTGKVIATRRSSPPDLDLPWLTDADMSNYLIAAQTQSAAKAYTGTKRPPNSDATYYKVLHGDTTIGTSFGTPFDKTFGTSGFGGDDFALAADGTLWLNGVVYCDGTLTIGSGVTSYRGSGMLVAKNGVVINGNLVPKGFLTGDANFIDTETYPGQTFPKVQAGDCLGVLTQGSVTMNGSGWGLAGAVFANGEFMAPNTGAQFRGSIIANGITFSQPNDWLVTQPGLKSALPQGMPALEGLRAEGDWIRQ